MKSENFTLAASFNLVGMLLLTTGLSFLVGVGVWAVWNAMLGGALGAPHLSFWVALGVGLLIVLFWLSLSIPSTVRMMKKTSRSGTQSDQQVAAWKSRNQKIAAYIQNESAKLDRELELRGENTKTRRRLVEDSQVRLATTISQMSDEELREFLDSTVGD